MSSTTRFAQVQKHPRYPLHAAVDIVTNAAAVEQLPLENISLGGVFIRTARPSPKGSTVRMRLRSLSPGALSPGGTDDGMTLGLVGRVVHVIDATTAAHKAHPPGMGVEFEGLSESTRAMLERLVDGLVDAARRERARRAAARYAPPSSVTVSDERAAVADLWTQGLEMGALFVESPSSPAFGTSVTVTVGPLTLHADVVHVDHGRGFGLQLTDLQGRKRAALQAYVDGTAAAIDVEVRVVGPPLGKVLACARRLFTGIDEDDPFGGIGLPSTADADEVRARCQGLVRLFSVPPQDASPPQAARVEAACRAAARLEPVLLARVAGLRKEAEAQQLPRVVGTLQVDVRDHVKELVLQAQALERQGERVPARKLYDKALEMAPDDAGVRARLASLNEQMDLARAADLVKSAEVFVNGVGMRDEALQRARQAVRLTKHRDIRLLALRVLVKAGEELEAQLLAEDLLDVDPRDPHALQVLLYLHERAKRWPAAARVGEALLRLKPADTDLQKRLKKIIENVRRS